MIDLSGDAGVARALAESTGTEADAIEATKARDTGVSDARSGRKDKKDAKKAQDGGAVEKEGRPQHRRRGTSRAGQRRKDVVNP